MIMSFDTPASALEWATIISKSKFCPKEFFNHPESVLVAIAYGAELGLKPLQALQNICVINGKPSIYGDAMLAVCKNHPDFEYIEEHCTDVGQNCVAHCKIKRRDQPEVKVQFSAKQAINAGLWNKPGPWKQYPERMLQMRARSFALRDCFPDVLKGLVAAEEAQDYVVKDITPPKPQLIPIDECATSITSNDKEVFDKLIELMHKNQIKEPQVVLWCKKANVEQIHQLPTDIMQKLIAYLETKEVTENEG